MRRRMLCAMLLILFSARVTLAADETDVDDFRLKTEGFPTPITITGDPRLRSITSVELAGSLKSGQGTITLNVGALMFNDFGDAIPASDEVAQPVAVRFERLVPPTQEFGNDQVETRQLYRINFADLAFAEQMSLVISTRTCDPHRLIINAPPTTKRGNQPPLQILDLQGTPQVQTTLPDPGQQRFQWACLIRAGVNDGLHRFEISGKPNGLVHLHLDLNHLGFNPYGDISFSTMMGISSIRSVLARQDIEDPTQAGRVIYHVVTKQNNLPNQYAVVLSPTALGPHRLIVRTKGQIRDVIPLHDPARRRFSRLYLQCAETSPCERAAVDELIRRLGYSFFVTVESNQITNLQINQATNLSDLDAVIPKLPHLKHLITRYATLSPAGLPSLQTLPHLETLKFEYGAISDAGLSSLAPLTNLRTLQFYRCTGLTDASLPSIGQLKNLTTLQLYRDDRPNPDEPATPGITDAGLIHLSGLTHLETLHLYGHSITDTGLAHLTAFENLKYLTLSGDGITDRGLQQLKALKHLQRLSLNAPQVTDEGRKELKAALPKLQDQ